ncbi:MAG: peptide/nickel transport system permease protein [Chloroflexota bacterium]|nr:peptide/nickel transport system permease protein [Chloroflexota bacterium]
MLGYIGRRALQIIPLLIALSILIFIIIQLPPGDYMTMYVQQLRLAGNDVTEAEITRLNNLYHLDRPLYDQFFLWIKGIVTEGNFGWSMQWNRPVMEVLGERIGLTIIVSILTLIFTWAVAIPIGIYTATHQYSLGDYFFTFLGFIGISVPGFLIVLVIVYTVFTQTGVAITGLFSQEYLNAPWSLARVADMLKHVWLPMIVIGLSGTAGLIRTMRGMLLDELQ